MREGGREGGREERDTLYCATEADFGGTAIWPTHLTTPVCLRGKNVVVLVNQYFSTKKKKKEI